MSSSFACWHCSSVWLFMFIVMFCFVLWKIVYVVFVGLGTRLLEWK